MKKNILWFLALLLPFIGFMSSCSSDDDIVFDHERQQFETRADRILLEFIAPFGTSVDEEIYIIGAFNGDSAAIGNPAYLLTKAPKSDMKWGVYIDPNAYVGGKTLADGFRFYSATQGMEYTIKGVQAIHNDNPAVGTFTNVWGQRWESYYKSADDEPTVEHDGFVVYVIDETGWDLHLYQWGDVNNLNGDWPGAAPTGTQTINGTKYLYWDMGAANTGLNQNLIFNDGGQGQQLADFAYTINHDVYLRVTTSGVEELTVGPKHDGFVVYVINKTTWDAITLYQWGDVNNLNGDWPGVEPTGTQTIKGNEYLYWDMGEANTGLNQNLIFNNYGGGTQLADFAYTIDHDVYLEVSDGGVTEIDPANYSGGDNPGGGDEPEQPGESHKFYIHDLTGWNSTGLYAWGEELPELFGEWPGKTDYTTETIGGIEFKVFEYTGKGDVYYPIYNGDGGQVDGPAVTTDRDYYFEVTGSSFIEIDKPSAGAHKIFIDNQTGWDVLGLYAWGEELPELFGQWPGKTDYSKETVNGTEYVVFTYDGDGQEYHLILNNAGAGSQVDGPAIITGSDYYFTVTNEGWTAK